GARSREAEREQALKTRVSEAVVRDDVVRQPFVRVGRRRRKVDAVRKRAYARERLQQASRCRLAAAELARHECQESDSDHGADPKPRRPDDGSLYARQLTRAPRLEPVRALA